MKRTSNKLSSSADTAGLEDRGNVSRLASFACLVGIVVLTLGCGESAAPEGGAHTEHTPQTMLVPQTTLVSAADTLWVCPMNDTPAVQNPGDCPVCGMHLHAQVVDDVGNDITPDDLIYTCPMHPDVVREHPGSCPECGMFLTNTTQAEHTAAGHGDAVHSAHSSAEIATPALMTMSVPFGELVTKYKCPMHPDFIRDDPGSCGICGMDLVEFTIDPNAARSDVQGLAVVTMDEAQRQRIGVRIATVRKMDVAREFVTTGRVVPDERRVSHIHTKFGGWVERLHVDYTGQVVSAGDPVLDIYSPELVAAQQEYLVARRSGRSDIIEIAEQRLRLLDMTSAQIGELRQSGSPTTSYTVYAPTSGTVIAKAVSAGHRIEAASTLYTIADLSRVWVLADAYETDLPYIEVGQPAAVNIASREVAGEEGHVTFVSPVVDVMSRTAPFRIELSNIDGRYRPGGFVDVSISIPLGERVVVPSESVLDSGIRKVVFVDGGEGRFEPREIETGVRTNGLIEARSGVMAGERVVAGATFFIDSESQLQAVMNASVTKGDDNGAAASTGHQH
jgi:membrane fusion protein, copper/silver efflux system